MESLWSRVDRYWEEDLAEDVTKESFSEFVESLILEVRERIALALNGTMPWA